MPRPAIDTDRDDWSAHRALRPLHSLRPWLLALGILLVVDVSLRGLLPPDPRVLRQPLRAHACMADAALDDLVALRALGDVSDRAGPPLDVVLLGDSVLGSVNNPPGQRLHDRLTQHLAGHGIRARLHNLSAGGAHAADQYAALLRLYRRLHAQPDGLRHLLVVLSTNPIFFSRRHSQPPALYPCLFEEISDAELGGAAVADALRRSLGVPRPAPRYEQAAAQALAHTWYLYQQRRRIGEALYGDHESLSAALLARLSPRRPATPSNGSDDSSNRPWSQRGLTAERYAASYDFLPASDPQALNARLTERLVQWLASHRPLQVLVEQVPQNHALMGAYTARPEYAGWQQQVRALFQQAGLSYSSHDRSPSLHSDHFQDLDHLTAAGNDRLAALIAADIAAVLAQPATSDPAAATTPPHAGDPSASRPSARQ